MAVTKRKKDRRANNGKNQDTRYDDTVPVQAYEHIRGGLSLVSTAKIFGISATTFFAWINKHPALKDAVDRAQSFKKGGGTDTFRDFVFGRLSPKARMTWKRIHRFERCRKENKIQALLERKGKHIRQQLFFYAIIAFNFNISLALRKVCLSHAQYQAWMQKDPDFARLVRELEWHKGNYFESALMKLVRDGDSAATIFASKTFNRARGYNDKVEHDVKVEFTVNPMNALLDKLPVDKRKEFLILLRQANTENLLTAEQRELTEIKEVIEEQRK